MWLKLFEGFKRDFLLEILSLLTKVFFGSKDIKY